MTDYLAATSLAGLERMAAEVLADEAHAYFSTGARDEITMRANRAAWDIWSIVPRVLRDTRAASTETTILGQKVGSPIMIAPMAAQKLAHCDGELATTRAASASGSIVVLSMSSTEPIEAVCAVDGSNVWLQLYVPEDPMFQDILVSRARAAGASALVVTVDSVLEESTHRRPHGQRPPGLPDLPMNPGHPMKSPLTWDFLQDFVERAPLPVVLKGILSRDDAEAAAKIGCAGVIVSNHGGRQLDGAVTSAQALGEVVEAVGSRLEVYVDGGIRRGSHILKALALGARGVLVGRPILWGLAVGGEAGVRRTLEILNEELLSDARQAGVTSMLEVPSELLTRSWLHPAMSSAESIRGQ